MSDLKVPRDENHIFYAKDVAISGDSHENTKQLPAQGKLNVFIGDLINPKKCPKKGTEAYEAWRKGYERKISAWTESVNQGETIFLLGNHEAQFISALVNGPDAANIFLYSQKTGQEKGKATLNALGVAVPEEEITQSNYDDFRNKVLENQTLNEYFFMLLKYGQLYAIVNNVYFSHTLPVTDKQGRLFPLTKEGKRGMEAM